MVTLSEIIASLDQLDTASLVIGMLAVFVAYNWKELLRIVPNAYLRFRGKPVPNNGQRVLVCQNDLREALKTINKRFDKNDEKVDGLAESLLHLDTYFTVTDKNYAKTKK